MASRRSRRGKFRGGDGDEPAVFSGINGTKIRKVWDWELRRKAQKVLALGCSEAQTSEGMEKSDF